MRVLILHSRYLSGPASGENRVVDDEVSLLRAGGHEVHVWQPSHEPGLGGLRSGARAVWSRSAAQEVVRLVRERAPDVVHCHALYPVLSPAVVRAAAAAGRPVVATLHNFRLLCAPATLLRDGRICEDCVGKVPWRAVVHRCYRSSTLASGALALSLTAHRTAGTFQRIALYLAVNHLLRDRHLALGISPERIRVKRNFCGPADARAGPGETFVYLGRLSVEKGVDVLMRAWSRDLPDLHIVGDGPARASLERLAAPNVTFAGVRDPNELPDLLRRARALLVPSRWYEGSPRAILEAFAAGVPVVASRIGALPELVEDGTNGFLVAANDADGWRYAARRLLDDGESERLGAGALASWHTRFTPEHALSELERAYEDAVAIRTARLS
jgi:glycosyltransferase involved in cell wall biosynthesis